MKVFIAYKEKDSYEAKLIKDALLRCGTEVCDRAVDDITSANDKRLRSFVNKNLDSCTDVIAVVSNDTKHHWWVQLLIETAVQRDMPAATFLSGWSELPEYLNCRPRLKFISDVESYAAERMAAEYAF